jgi:hypothetical protein
VEHAGGKRRLEILIAGFDLDLGTGFVKLGGRHKDTLIMLARDVTVPVMVGRLQALTYSTAPAGFIKYEIRRQR